MKKIWSVWHRLRHRKTAPQPAVQVDSFLVATAMLFSEWDSPEDTQAFRNL